MVVHVLLKIVKSEGSEIKRLGLVVDIFDARAVKVGKVADDLDSIVRFEVYTRLRSEF